MSRERPDSDVRFGEPRASRWIVRLAGLLDARYRLPLLGWRFGLDALIGLVPVVGDVVGMVLGAALVWEGFRLRLPAAVLARMLANLGVDALLGSVPVVGDLTDFAFRAHARNLALLRGGRGGELTD